MEVPEPQNLSSVSALVRSRRLFLLLQSSWALTHIYTTCCSLSSLLSFRHLRCWLFAPPLPTRGEGTGVDLRPSRFFVGCRCLFNLISDRILLPFDRIQSFWRFSIYLESDLNFWQAVTSNRHITFICRILDIQLIGNLTTFGNLSKFGNPTKFGNPLKFGNLSKFENLSKFGNTTKFGNPSKFGNPT